jgi:hypothetical protein
MSVYSSTPLASANVLLRKLPSLDTLPTNTPNGTDSDIARSNTYKGYDCGSREMGAETYCP